MNTSPRNRRAPRQALAAVATVAGAVLLLAPVAGASASQQPPAVADEQAHEQSNAENAPPAHPGTPNDAADARAEQRDENAETRGPSGNGEADRPTPNNGSAEPESPGASGEHKHTICHRTRSATNPYVKITVDFHAVDGELVESDGDHAERHEGPVFDSSMSSGDAWGDIIPPIGDWEGQNWAEGEAIFDNDCAPVETQPGGGETPGVDEEDEDEDGNVTVPGGEEIAVEGDDEENVGGEVVVTTPTVDAPQQTPAAPQVNVPGEVDETAVLGTTVSRTPGADAAVAGTSSGTLPRTGAGTGLLAAVGAALVGAGFTLQKSSRRLSVTD